MIAEAVERDEPRLRSFIRKRVLDMGDAEDVLQDVFYELIAGVPDDEAGRAGDGVAVPGGAESDYGFVPAEESGVAERAGWREEEALTLEDLLPSPDAGPDAIYARNVMLEALDEALEELPENQREVFVAHELMGQSFKEMSEETGVSVNTLLSRKRYAVLHLRERLQEIEEDFGK